jgi:GNAT superfamily N-acetyltransferase
MAAAATEHGAATSEELGGVVVRACMSVAPEAVFGVIRCKTKTGIVVADASTTCTGAQDALAVQATSGASSAGKLSFRPATAADKHRAMELINAAYMAEAFIKMEFAEQRISEETFDACVANESGKTELLLAVDEGGAIVGTAMLNPPEGTAAGHAGTDTAAHLGFAAVDPAKQKAGIGPKLITRVETRAVELGFASLEFSFISPMEHLEGWYRKLGYELTGVVETPEGDGWLKPEWRGKVKFPHMAKDLTREKL